MNKTPAVSTEVPAANKAGPAMNVGQLMLTVEDVAKVLICSPRTVYRLAERGRIPKPCKFGALLRWPRHVIDAWVAQACPDCRGGIRRN